MRSFCAGFLLGVCGLQQLARLPSWGQTALYGGALLGLALACVWLARRLRARRQLARAAMLCAAASLLAGGLGGWVWAAYCAQERLQARLGAQWERRDVVLSGVISSLPHQTPLGLQFIFTPDPGQVLSPQQRLYLGWHKEESSDRAPVAHAAERWRFCLRIGAPHGHANPAGFDYEAWAFAQNLQGGGQVVPARKSAPDCQPQRLAAQAGGPGARLARWREDLRSRILQALPGAPYAGVLVALVIGEQRAIAHSDWQLFNAAGIGHLLSISGLHITMLAALCGALAGWLWRHSFFTRASLPLYWPAPYVAAVCGCLAAAGYVLLAGAEAPALRTLYMLIAATLCRMLWRNLPISVVLAWALLAVLLPDPWAVLSAGFWLSFGAVALLLYAGSGRRRDAQERLTEMASWRRQAWVRLRQEARAQGAVTFGLLPLSVLLFAQISLLSPFANALAIPLISLGVTPLALLGAASLTFLPEACGAALLQAAHWLLQALAALVAQMHSVLPPWRLPQAGWPAFACASVGLLFLFLPLWRARLCALAAMLPLVLQPAAHPAPGALWLTALDVGQGTALLIETERHRMLYDSGPAYPSGSDAGQQILLPYLQARGISALDGMMISHADADHAGGAASLMQGVRLGWWRSSLDPQHALRQSAAAQALPHIPCRAGQEWEWDGWRFAILHPDPTFANASRSNARSCVLKISHAQAPALLLAGDIEAAQEAHLLARGAPLRAAILLAPHHGSGTSSSVPFLQAVQPELALFQVGWHNRYRHPRADVWQRYAELGIWRARTDREGALLLQLDAAGWRMHSQRASRQRYWQTPMTPE
ncbi:DNA internalization-related competence protein ComEC/Rec2 [Massilia sp. W12]|uniref:DNA internalization-related competence protein ComEC/Rec2 n=1 Tax=Massilia sp. W12 TaxID=3126507 RepID=UPI0030D29BFB